MVRSLNFAETEVGNTTVTAKVYPKIKAASLPICNKITLPITQLYNDGFWDGLAHQVNCIAEVDSLSFCLSRSEFKRYAARIAQSGLKCVSFFGKLYSPLLISTRPIEVFDEEVYFRTKVLHRLMKEHSPNTVLISPSVDCLAFEAYKHPYLDYLMHHRQFFDCYGVTYSGSLSENDVRCMTFVLSETKNFAHKEIWFTDFKLSCCSHGLPLSNFLGVTEYPPTQSVMANRLNNFFMGLRSLSKEICVFYTGLYSDDYTLAGNVDTNFNSCPSGPHLQWSANDFYGLVDYHGSFKDQLFDALLNIERQNAYQSKFDI